MPDQIAVRCAGCGKGFPADRQGKAMLAEVELAPGLAVALCAKEGHYHDGGRRPRGPCLRSAVWARDACPGCGKKFSGVTICPACVDDLAEMAKIRASEGGDVKTYTIDPGAFGWRGDSDEEKRLARALCALASPRGRWWATCGDGRLWATGRSFPPLLIQRRNTSAHTDMPAVELTAAQAEAVVEFARHAKRCAIVEYQKGFDAGADLLAAVARGEDGIEAFRERHQRQREALAEALAAIDAAESGPPSGRN